MAKKGEFSDELEALKVVLGALNGLDIDKREFVIKTTCNRLEIRAPKGKVMDYAAIAAILESSSAAARMLVLAARRRVLDRLRGYLQP